MTAPRHLPGNTDLNYFTVTCHLAPIVADYSQDADYDPNLARIDAVVTFTPKYKSGEVIHAHAANPPTGFLAMPVTAVIDDGYLKLRTKPDAGAVALPGTLHGLKAKIAADTGQELAAEADTRAALNYAPVRLLGNSSTLEIEPDQPLYYDFSFSSIRVDNKSTNITITGGTFEAPWEDTVIDLLDWMPLTPGPYAQPVVVGPQGPQGEIGPPGPAGPAEGAVEYTVNKGQPDGYAPLDANGDVPVEHIPFYAVGDAYNWRPDNTRKLQQSIARAHAGLPAHHLFIGDSITAGYMGVWNTLTTWPLMLRQQLNTRGMPVGGTGWVMSGLRAGTSGIVDPRWGKFGTWTEDASPSLQSSEAGASLTFYADLPGTSVTIAYPESSGPFTVTINDATPVAVTPTVTTAGVEAVATTTFTGLQSKLHKVTMTRTSGTVTIHAVKVDKPGMQFHNVALSGSAAANWAPAEFPHRSWVVDRLGINPDVVHIALGVNDIRANLPDSPTQTAANIATIRAKWPNAEPILYAQPQPQGVTNWPEYVEKLYALADSLDCPLVDIGQRFGGSYDAANASGLMAETVHPNATAHAVWGLFVTQLATARG